ncbi:MAG TPA: DUF309 domain-containing protein [Gemmataceae bacterium]|nr:DUF309 domain-containing protein [Gemmataceae bacterium]
MASVHPPRLVPEMAFPPYAFVPGFFPHPLSSPLGHSFGSQPEHPACPDATNWQACRPFLRGVDLFNYGYYWEAHEVWEGLWNACGRHGMTADFLKGLIQLAAAGVKFRQGVTEGVQTHAQRAAALFCETAVSLGEGAPRYMGLQLSELISFAQTLAACRAIKNDQVLPPVEVIFDFVLSPF